MRRRVIITLAILVAAVLFGAWLGSQSPYAVAQAVTPTLPYPVAPVIPGAGTHVQLWMASPFCVDTWWDGRQCAEHKGDELHVGAGWKLDLPGPAWIAPQGKDAQGQWLLWSVAKSNDQPPGVNFTAVIGPSLFTVSDVVTASPTPTATVTPPPTGATATPSPTVASGATVTPSPSPQGETPSAQPPTGTPTRPIMTITPTPMFPEFPTCTTQILIYRAGDPAEGGLGGKIGGVVWCGSCNSGCGMWMFGVDKATLDGWTSDANRRVHELWATATVQAR